jgi:hypothetical protein
MAGPPQAIARRRLIIDQACGADLDEVRAARRRLAMEIERLEDLVPLGAVLADLDRFDAADSVYWGTLFAP